MVDTKQFSRTCIKRWRRTRESDTAVEHPIVLNHLESLNDVALVSESLNLLVAGSDTSAVSLTVTVLEILSNPGIEKRLVEELDASIPDKESLPPFQSLEKIEYLVSRP
jgi:cytochrome P450